MSVSDALSVCICVRGSKLNTQHIVACCDLFSFPHLQGSSMSQTKSSQRFHSLNAEQVEVLHQVLSEAVPIHGRGNFPTLELRPRDIIIAVRASLQNQGITVRDVRLNGSTASHVLVRDNGTSYKDLDIIFGVELPSQEEFQVRSKYRLDKTGQKAGRCDVELNSL